MRKFERPVALKASKLGMLKKAEFKISRSLQLRKLFFLELRFSYHYPRRILWIDWLDVLNKTVGRTNWWITDY